MFKLLAKLSLYLFLLILSIFSAYSQDLTVVSCETLIGPSAFCTWGERDIIEVCGNTSYIVQRAQIEIANSGIFVNTTCSENGYSMCGMCQEVYNLTDRIKRSGELGFNPENIFGGDRGGGNNVPSLNNDNGGSKDAENKEKISNSLNNFRVSCIFDYEVPSGDTDTCVFKEGGCSGIGFCEFIVEDYKVEEGEILYFDGSCGSQELTTFNRGELTVVYDCTGKNDKKDTDGLVEWSISGVHEDKLDLVFLFEGYSGEDVERYLKNIFTESSKSLLKTSPFLINKDKINVYYKIINEVDDYKDGIRFPKCSFDKLDVDTTVLTNTLNNYNWIDGSVYIVKNPSVWPHAVPQQFIKISSACNPFGDVNIYPPTFTHEMGHLISGLEDEYVIEGSRGISRSLNCAFNEGDAQKKWRSNGISFETLIPGCRSSNLFRSKENTIMKDQVGISDEEWPTAWGSVNEYYILRTFEQFK